MLGAQMGFSMRRLALAALLTFSTASFADTAGDDAPKDNDGCSHVTAGGPALALGLLSLGVVAYRRRTI